MSDFAIRNTGVIAQKWSQEITGMKPPILFGSKTTNQESVAKSKDAFKQFFGHNLSSLSGFVPSQQMLNFEAVAAAKLNQIINATFDKVQADGHGSFKKSEVHTALKAANTEAQAAIKELSRLYYGKTAMDWDKQVEAASKFPAGGKEKVSADAYGQANADVMHYVTAKAEDMGALVPPAKQEEFARTIRDIRSDAKRSFGEAQAECLAQGGKMPATKFQETVRKIGRAS
ncbi:MAG: hypothetical protein ACOYMG_29350, partial [Candidatus Methylumidiphilus sp.]